MADIRKYIENTLLTPLKYYPTAIQHTMIELIIEMLENLYDYTVKFPEIVSPNSDRLDILKVIADQFLFHIRDEAELQEQIDILRNILEIYNKRGSIDTIENMWKYYGGDLPKEVQVIIPSYKIFRYNISTYSGSHVYEDSVTNRTGAYEIKLTNNTYPIPDLRDFLINELVAAGNYIYFSNDISLDLRHEFNKYGFKYDIEEDIFLDIQMKVAPSYQGMTLSGPNSLAMSGSFNEIRYQYQQLTEEQKDSGDYEDIIRLYNLLSMPDINTVWSGKENIFVDIVNIIESEARYNYIADTGGFRIDLIPCIPVIENMSLNYESLTLILNQILYCTPSRNDLSIDHDIYNADGELMRPKYFILGESLLGNPLGYESVV